MAKYYHPDTDFFVKRNLAVPSSVGHGTDEELREKIKPLKPHSWRMQGNKLIGETEYGPITQFLPTDYICKGEDKDGLPILEKIVL